MLLLVLFVGVNAGCGGYYVGFGVDVATCTGAVVDEVLLFILVMVVMAVILLIVFEVVGLRVFKEWIGWVPPGSCSFQVGLTIKNIICLLWKTL